MANKYGRRKFLGTMSCAAIGYTTFYNSVLNLKAINALAAANSALDPEYKAIVCLLLSGGNDSFNMLVPTSPDEYLKYKTARSNLAIDKGDLIPLNVKNTPGREFGLHPALSELGQLFNSGKACFISNIGTLVEKTNKPDFINGVSKVPDALFSHNDQMMQWQTSLPTGRHNIGWAGRMADLIRDMNTEQSISMNMSLAGTNIFEVGNEVIEYVLDPNNGSIGIAGYDPPMEWYTFDVLRTKAIDSMLTAEYKNAFEKTYINIIRNAQASHEKFQKAIEVAPEISTPFPEGYLANAFKMAARTISAHKDLGFKRQVFLIDYSGWDHHDELLNNQNEMFTELDAILSSFQKALEELNLDKNVVTFTMSEFGRGLSSNGNGTDHAWGGNVFAIGSNVLGANIFGSYPDMDYDGPDVVYHGAFIPSTPTELYFAELALWMGVARSDLPYVLPNIGNFYNIHSHENPLGFINL